MRGRPSGRSFVASGLCDEVQPGRNGPAPWTRHDAFYITSFGCGCSERGNYTVGRDANEGWSNGMGGPSALSFRVPAMLDIEIVFNVDFGSNGELPLEGFHRFSHQSVNAHIDSLIEYFLSHDDYNNDNI